MRPASRLDRDTQRAQFTAHYVQGVDLGADGGVLARIWSATQGQPSWIKVELPRSMTLEAAAAAAGKGPLIAQRRAGGWMLAIDRER
jgi:hypothetical protein